MRSKFVNHEVLERLRRSIGAEDWLPFEVALQTGLRIGDVAALPLSSIDESGDGYVIRYRAAKTGKYGEAAISPELAVKLLRQKGDWLFPGRKSGTHITRQALWARLKAACRRLGIDDKGLSPHSLRKCFAVAVRQREGFAAVRDALQHESDAVTRVYAYADTIMRAASDEAIRWNEIEIIVDYILERLAEKAD